MFGKTTSRTMSRTVEHSCIGSPCNAVSSISSCRYFFVFGVCSLDWTVYLFMSDVLDLTDDVLPTKIVITPKNCF